MLVSHSHTFTSLFRQFGVFDLFQSSLVVRWGLVLSGNSSVSSPVGHSFTFPHPWLWGSCPLFLSPFWSWSASTAIWKSCSVRVRSCWVRNRTVCARIHGIALCRFRGQIWNWGCRSQSSSILDGFVLSICAIKLFAYSQIFRPSPQAKNLCSRAGVGKLLVVFCRSNVTKSHSVPTHPSPPYFYKQQPLKHINLILY